MRATRGVSLRYHDDWVDRGFALSEDLPLLRGHEFLPTEKDTAAGAVDDARPDRWGERVIRVLDRPPRLSLLEYLYFAGDDRFGGLGVSTSPVHYEPRRFGPLPTLADAQAIHEVVVRVLASEPVDEPLRRLLAPGATMGGARPKALLQMEGRQWVVKFSDGDPIDTPLVEHAAMTLARRAGIRVAQTRPIPLLVGHALAIDRFDRRDGRRLHALTANVVLRAAGEQLGYPELAQTLRRRGVVAGGVAREQQRELFRRMVYNILIDNTDDHEKNHALLLNDAGHYQLAPAYDVLPSGQALGYQQFRVGEAGAEATLSNAVSECEAFGLGRTAAEREIAQVAEVVAAWRGHFERSGVTRGDIELVAEHVDRPFLRDQRDAYAG